MATMASYQKVDPANNRKPTATMKVLDDAADDGKTPRASTKVISTHLAAK